MSLIPAVDRLAGRAVLFVMAADAEYGPHLRRRIRPTMIGVGPVEAAVSVSVALAAMQAAGHLPDLVVSLGSAGSRTLDHAGTYQVSSVAYRDMDASPLGFPKGITPFLDLPAVVALPYAIPGIPAASIASGASIVTGSGYDGIEADMVDMESFAVLRACQRFAVPLIGLRGISDGRSDLVGLSDWTAYLHVIDERLGEDVDRLEAALADGSIALRHRP